MLVWIRALSSMCRIGGWEQLSRGTKGMLQLDCGSYRELEYGWQTGFDMAAVHLGIGVDWVCCIPGWAGFQHSLVLARARVVVGWTGLGLGNW